MTKELIYPGADRKSRWYPPAVVGVEQPALTKCVWHSTETSPEWDCPGYSGGLVAPTFTVNPWPGREKVWQHFPANQSAKALKDPSTTAVRENRDEVVQIEVIGYSQRSTNPKYWLGALPDSGLEYLSKLVVWLYKEWGTPLALTPLRWTFRAQTNPNDPRYDGAGYDAFKGHLGHRHVSGNDHWDPSLDVARILDFARTAVQPAKPAPIKEDTSMPTAKEIADAVWNAPLPDPHNPGKTQPARVMLAQAYRQSTLGVNLIRAAGLDVDAIADALKDKDATP